MAAMPAHAPSRRPTRNYWDLLDGWTASSARDHLSPNTQIVFYALLHMANRRFFPSVMDVDKKTLAALAKVSREAVRRALSVTAAERRPAPRPIAPRRRASAAR